MPDPVKHALVGVFLLAGTLIFLPVVLTIALYGLAAIGVFATARMLVRILSPRKEPVVGFRERTPAKGSNQPDTPGRPR